MWTWQKYKPFEARKHFTGRTSAMCAYYNYIRKRKTAQTFYVSFKMYYLCKRIASGLAMRFIDNRNLCNQFL